MITRRHMLGLTASAIGAAVLLGAFPALAQQVSKADLAYQGPLGDVVLGSADAPVTIIEYASMTCPHCAAFHKEVFPALKSRYIDTGKVRFILREFPLDPLATAGFMLARCEGNDKYYPITDLLFDQQRNWAYADKPLDALIQVMRQAGFSREKVESCLSDQKLLTAVNAVKSQAADKLKIDSTPTFFINGQRHSGEMSIDAFEKVIKPMLGG